MSEETIIDLESFGQALGPDGLRLVMEELHAGRRLKQHRVAERTAAAAHRMQGTVWLDEIGPCDFVIDPVSFHEWGQFFSYDSEGNWVRDGYECWNDETFVREYVRDNPECRVRQVAPKLTILNAWGGVASEVEAPAPAPSLIIPAA